MTKTLIDIDDDLMAKAQEVLGTATKKDTVNAALRAAVRERLVEELLAMGRAGAFADLADPDFEKRMWRQ